MKSTDQHIEFLEHAIQVLNDRIKKAENNVTRNILQMGIKNRLLQIERIKNKTL